MTTINTNQFVGINDPEFNLVLIGALVEKLGGRVVVSQSDLDAVAYKRITENLQNGVYTLQVHTRTKQ